ncbi:MAG: carbohydrate kinase [Gammaproteobacteria bacterium]|nr:carbohydrate kinase [Gammaproteobacteria bacterium]
MTGNPLIFGEVLFDCFDDNSRVLGGAPFNVAWHLRAFGLSPLLVSRVGDDPLGRQIRAAMDGWGLSTAGLQLDSVHPTGRVSVSLKAGEPSFDILDGAAYDYIQRDMIPPVTPSLIYHGTLALRSPDSAATLAHIRERYPAPVFMDINLRPPWWDKPLLERYLPGVRWLKINENELDTLAGANGSVQSRVQRVMDNYQISLVILTRGGAGAMAVTADGAEVAVTPKRGTQVVDTVGAGDAFASVCIFGLASGWPMDSTLDRAQSFASLIVSQRGATIADPQPYLSLLQQWDTALSDPFSGKED